MEDIMVHYDGTVRNSLGSIVQVRKQNKTNMNYNKHKHELKQT